MYNNLPYSIPVLDVKSVSISSGHSALVTGIALTLASLGFLGLGALPPEPEWGRVLTEGMPYLERACWVVLAPAVALAVLSVMGVSLACLSGLKK